MNSPMRRGPASNLASSGDFHFICGVFALMVIGVDMLFETLKLIIQEHLPALTVLRAMAWRMPGILVLTLPMALIFATLMAFGELSGHGEVTAMRAGGIGLYRIAAPTLTLGLLISVVSFGLNGWAVPYANSASEDIMASMRNKSTLISENLWVTIPSKGPPDLAFYARKFDPDKRTLTGLLVIEFKQGLAAETLTADWADWVGDTWVLHEVQRRTPDNRLLMQAKQVKYQLGRSPWEIAAASRKPRWMTMAELGRIINEPQAGNLDLQRQALEEWSMRLAVPWAGLGLALIGLPLGIRPTRTSTGTGLGISLAVILAYYIAMSAMRILGQKGNLPPMVADWLPNVLLYTTGLGLLINKSR